MDQPGVAANETVTTAAADQRWDLRLYVSGQSPRSLRAIENLRRACEEHLAGRCQVEILDLLQDPRRAAEDQILAVPTLVRRLPSPVRKSSATCLTPISSSPAWRSHDQAQVSRPCQERRGRPTPRCWIPRRRSAGIGPMGR